MIKTSIVIHDENHETISAVTDLDFTTAVQAAMQGHPFAVYDVLYEPVKIRAIDLTENEIEIDAIII